MKEQKEKPYAKWSKGYILLYRILAVIFIIFGILCLISDVGWILGVLAILFSILFLYVARCAEKGLSAKETPTTTGLKSNNPVPNTQNRHNTVGLNRNNTSSQPNLLYEHNRFKFDIFDSFTVKSTGEKWLCVYKYENVEIYRPDTSFSEIFENDIVDVIPEPTNPYDPNAVSIQFHENILGYLNKGTIQDMVHDYLKRKELIRAMVQKIDGTKIYLKMYFCKPRNIVLPHQEPIIVKLLGNSNETIQENIGCCDVGDEILLNYDIDKEKYYVLCSNLGIGYLPKPQQNTLQGLADRKYEFSGQIVDISENKSNKYIVTVKIQPE